MRDFLISRADADAEIAAWISAELRNLGFTTLDHEELLKDEYEQVVAVCSPAYFAADHTAAEWRAAASAKSLTPILWRKCTIPRQLRDLPAIDFRGRSEEERRFLLRRFLGTKHTARQILLSKLPAIGRSLFGRNAQLKELDGAWISPDVRVMSIVGPVGVGKSALAINWWLQNQAKGAARVLGWSFYSQGASPERQVATDPFFDRALRAWFRTPDPPATSWDRGTLLAELLRQEPTLLILDGLELLQDSDGGLKDLGVLALLKGLAAGNPGLCICTSRVPLTDLAEVGGVLDMELESLTQKSAVEYLRALNVSGTNEDLQQAAVEFGTNPLDLSLFGRYLVDAFFGDVLQRNEIPNQGSLAREIIRRYDVLFQGRERQLELMALRILGLFDRPADLSAIAVVRRTSFFSALAGDPYWSLALTRLRDARLVYDTENDATVDCHPLVRAHFAQELRENHPDAFAHAQNQLYQFYAKEAPRWPEMLEAMAPLFDAVYHGCQAGKHQDTCEKVYLDRVVIGEERFLTKKLGAYGIDLTLLANFFETPWDKPLAALLPEQRGWLMAEAACSLRALGRLPQAIAPMKLAAQAAVDQEEWKRAATRFGNLSEFYVTSGRIPEAMEAARKAVELADRSADLYERMAAKTILADALHHTGDLDQAAALFAEAEALQAERQPDYPLLYSVMGYQYCDLLLAQHRATDVLERGAKALEWSKGWLLDIALAHLSLGRAHPAGSPESVEHLDQAVEGLRKAGALHHLPRALLARATERDLEEVRELAMRCGMGIYLKTDHGGTQKGTESS